MILTTVVSKLTDYKYHISKLGNDVIYDYANNERLHNEAGYEDLVNELEDKLDTIYCTFDDIIDIVAMLKEYEVVETKES
jgi:phosphosulfolactate phosphohydrolase-like enzyme